MAQGFFIAHRARPVPTLQPEFPAAPTARPRGNRPLMADIARLAGVSIATVSRALSGDRMVAARTRARIAGIAQSLHYGVDARARGLRLGENDAVSVVVPKSPHLGPHPGPSLADPFMLELLGSLTDALAAQGRTMLLSRPAMLQADALARDVATGRAVGLVIVGQGQHHDQLQAMAAQGVPFAVWGAPLDGQRYATVGGDNLVGGRLAAGHLLDRGARRVAFVGDTRQPEMALRHAGYLQAHRARGVTPVTAAPTPWPAAPVPPDDPGLQVVQALAHTPAVDAVLAGSDLLAMAVVHRLRQLGRRVPEDVLVAGHDDTAMGAQFHPPLTSVSPSTAQAGAALLRALDAVLAGQAPAPLLLPTHLQVRPSSSAGLRG